MPLTLFARWATVTTLGLGLLGGGVAHATTPEGTDTFAPPVAHRGDTQAGRGRAKPRITKVLTFVVENHSLAQMRRSMPFVHNLAEAYAYADHYRAITHPSLPNYLAIASGSTRGITDDRDPSAHRLRGATVFDQAIARGRSATVYADSMTSNCQLRNNGNYAVRHNPWAYFVRGRANCRRHDVPVRELAVDTLAGALPNVGMVIPNLVHDAHNAQLRVADAWIKRRIKRVQTGDDWKSGHLAIVVTADEDDRRSRNRVLTVVASRYQTPGVVHTPLTHYSLTRLYESVIGARYLANARTAPSMSAAFGIRTPPRH